MGDAGIYRVSVVKPERGEDPQVIWVQVGVQCSIETDLKANRVANGVMDLCDDRVSVTNFFSHTVVTEDRLKQISQTGFRRTLWFH